MHKLLLLQLELFTISIITQCFEIKNISTLECAKKYLQALTEARHSFRSSCEKNFTSKLAADTRITKCILAHFSR
jgi:hypothetical protein